MYTRSKFSEAQTQLRADFLKAKTSRSKKLCWPLAMTTISRILKGFCLLPALCQSPHPPPLEVPRSFGPPGARNNFTVISPPPRPALSTRDAAHAAAVARALSTSASSGMNGAFPGRRVEPPWTPQRLPYDGSLPAAQAAQDRHAIRFLMEVQMPSCQNQEGSSNAGRLQEKAAASPLRVRVSASLSVPLSSSACTRDPEQWTRFQNADGNLWWWCEASQIFFFEQDSGPWKKFCDSVSKRLWWWNEQTGGYFFVDSESG